MLEVFHSAQDPVSFQTHAIGAMVSFIGSFMLLFRGIATNTPMPALAASMCFALSLIALYTASAVYHYYPGTATTGGAKRMLRKMDHSMIYVLIAGSYTPFSVVLLPQPRGMRFCGILWGVAILGTVLKLAWINAPRILSTMTYLVMGWAIIFVAKDFLTIGQPCLTLIALGGLCYSVGAVFYAIKKPNISKEWTFHELFHLLILAGSLFHYLAVYLCVL